MISVNGSLLNLKPPRVFEELVPDLCQPHQICSREMQWWEIAPKPMTWRRSSWLFLWAAGYPLPLLNTRGKPRLLMPLIKCKDEAFKPILKPHWPEYTAERACQPSTGLVTMKQVLFKKKPYLKILWFYIDNQKNKFTTFLFVSFSQPDTHGGPGTHC